MPDNLNAEVARRLWGTEPVATDGCADTRSGFIEGRFDSDMAQCREHMLPALEKRGLANKFYAKLELIAATMAIPWNVGYCVLKLPPRAWCEAFIEAWDGGAK